jgi:hypothetical protein
MTIAACLSLIAVIVSFMSYRVASKNQKQSQKSFDIEHSNTLICNLKVEEVEGHSLKTSFKILNHGKNNITINKVQLSGRAKSSVGDDYGILNDTLGSDGTKTIAPGGDIDFKANFVIGYGQLKTLELSAFVQGINSKHEEFRIAIPVDIKYT